MSKNTVLIFLLLMLLIGSTALSQNVTIKGVAPTHHGKEIALYTYSDLITYTETKDIFDTVDSKGNFELKLDVFHQQAVLLKIGKLSGKLYLEPYYQYGIVFPPADTGLYVNTEAEQSVDINIVGDSTELNARIIDFNVQFDEFWYKNYESFVTKRIHLHLDSFQLNCNKRYGKVKNNYFKTYIDYTIALMNENTGRHHNYLAQTYLINKPIHYYNYEYMQFFNQYFKQYLQTKVISKMGANVIDLINEQGNYQALSAVLKDDPILKNDTLRELVILKAMFELYYVPKYNKEKITSIVQQIQQQTRVKEHQLIASNILLISRKLQPGAAAPGFVLKDSKGIEHALSDYKGKYIYLEFFATWSTGSLQEMKKLEQVKNKYGDKVVFISISIDDSLKDFKDFVKKNPKYNWVLLHCGANHSLKEQYDIKTAPAYFLINPEGYFVQSPALKPSEGIEFKFKQMFRERKR